MSGALGDFKYSSEMKEHRSMGYKLEYESEYSLSDLFHGLKGLWVYFRKYKFPSFLVLVFSILGAFFGAFSIGLLLPLFTSLEGGSLSAVEGPLRYLYQISLLLPIQDVLLAMLSILFLAILIKATADYLRGILGVRVQRELGKDLRFAVMRQYMEIGYEFIDRREKGQMGEDYFYRPRVTSQVVTWFASIINELIMFTTLLVFLFLLSWKILLVCLILLALFFVLSQGFFKKVKSLGDFQGRIQVSLTGMVLEILGGLRAIKDFGREKYEQKVLGKELEEFTSTMRRIDIRSNLIKPSSELMAVLILIGLILFSVRVLNQPLSSTAVVVIVVMRLMPSLTNFYQAVVQFLSSSHGVFYLYKFLSKEDKPYVPNGTIKEFDFQKELKFSGVYFGYYPSKPVLEGVSITFPKGKTTAVVGPSGAGKSTIIELILRFYDPQKGEIYIDDLPLKEADFEYWRKKIGIVRQDTWIFNTSIKENIQFGAPEATFQDIVEAACLAGADGFAEDLANKYDTIVGDRGVMLSGGQRQRIAIARALVRKPEILIFDEATSMLDSLSEKKVQAAIENLRHDYTLIVIAHRLSTVQNMDNIIVINDGQIIETGDHEELIAKKGLYWKLWNIQQEGEE